MKRTAVACFFVALGLVSTGAGQGGRAPARLDEAFTAYWNAADSREAERAAKGIVEAGADFEAVWTRVKAGRPYSREKTGVQQLPTTVDGQTLENLIEVPVEYDPTRKWPLRVQLHGGVSRPYPRPGEPGRSFNNRIPGDSQIYLHPRAWEGTEWWRGNQVDNIFALVDAVKRKYNVDESQVYVAGISDGGTGVYFLAMRASTPWSVCATLIGHPAVLSNPRSGAEQQLYFTNLVNCPMYVVNSGRDRLYPADSVVPFVETLKRAEVPVEFHVHPEGGHDTNWWPQERPLFDKFVASHKRVAHPERLSWETDRVDRYNRVRWLTIDALGRRPSDVALEDVNSVEEDNQKITVFSRYRPSGRVDVVRKGNAFEARTRGVQQFTLLLSPDVVDFSKPVQVKVNGRTAFERPVKKDTATLVKWAARDNDRTMLYGAELRVAVP